MADKKWYVLRTAGTKEKKAAEYLVKEIERHADLQSVVDQVLKITQEVCEKQYSDMEAVNIGISGEYDL